MRDIVYLRAEAIYFDIEFLCNLIVNILNDNEDNKFNYVKVDKIMFGNAKYINYFIITDCANNTGFSSYEYSQFKSFLEEKKRETNTFVIRWGECNIENELLMLNTIDDLEVLADILRDNLAWWYRENKHWRFPGTFDHHDYDIFDGLFDKYQYLKDVFELFFEFRKRSVPFDLPIKTVGWAEAHSSSDKYQVLYEIDPGWKVATGTLWNVIDIEEYNETLNKITNNQYQLFDIYKKEYKGRTLEKGAKGILNN